MPAFTFTAIDISQPIGSDAYVAADGIDAAGEAVGSYGYTDGNGDSYFHGFTATGSVGTTFDPPGSSNTNGIGITASGEIFGDFVDGENRQHGFVDINGVFQQIDVLLASSTIVDGVTNAGTIFGTYVDGLGSGINGFIDNNGSFTILDVPGAATTSISGINAAGEIVGTYTDPSGRAHGFTDIGGTFATIDPAGSISTSLVGVSATGEVAGNYENGSSVNNGFIDANGIITTIAIPGATSTGVSAINDAGEVVGYYADSLGNVHGFINQNGVTTTLDVPGATQTDIYGVNDSASSGTDRIWLQAYNGQWSEAFANITDPGTPAPVVTANNQSVTAGQQVALSSLFSVGGSGISQYKVWFSYPEGGSPAVGTLTNNGAPIVPDQWVTLNSLSGWLYTGSAASGTDRIWLQAYNGQWSEALANITDPGTPAPVVTANNQSVTAGQQVALSSLFSVGGSGISQYKVWFSYPEGGSPAVGTLTHNGTPIVPDQWVTLNSLSGWQYTGSASSGTDRIWLQAYNGQWSEALANITDPGTPAPVVTANNQSVTAGQQVALSSLFSVGGSGISQYKVWFSYPEGGSPAVGTLTHNGTPIAPDQWVTLNSLSGWQYTGSANSGTDRIWLQAYNGQWSEAFASITDPGATSASHISASQLSGLGNEQSGLDHTVSLLSQYMASSFGNSDSGPTDPVADPKGAFQDQPTLLAPSPLAQSHPA